MTENAQEFAVGQEDQMCLSALRKKHSELGFKGQCIVRFHPSHFASVIDLPNFVPVEKYKYVVPIDPLEVGGVEVFRMIPTSPIEYAAEGFW